MELIISKEVYKYHFYRNIARTRFVTSIVDRHHIKGGAKLVVFEKEKYAFLALSYLGEKIVFSPKWIWAPGLFDVIPARLSNYHLNHWGLD